eukprot:TRINITY_DN35334_c0_g1_i1.p1 TRINITY_DN35334_c0_g1~~TRINITY_DN35334_c0_g1_i1.p1  ORF type:complete len:100 (+),score=8.42 TRINITY_DN35334_c0_g1_i1:103-402(+)
MRSSSMEFDERFIRNKKTKTQESYADVSYLFKLNKKHPAESAEVSFAIARVPLFLPQGIELQCNSLNDNCKRREARHCRAIAITRKKNTSRLDVPCTLR